MQEYMISTLHDGYLIGHPDWEETRRTIQENFYWAYMQADVNTYVQSCRICACTKRRPYQPKASQKPRQPQKSWEVISTDIMGSYLVTAHNKRYIVLPTHLFNR